MNILIYLMVASVFLAAQVFTIDIGFMQLSIFRATLLLISIYFMLENLKTNRKFRLSFEDNSSSFIKFYFFWFVYSVVTIGWVKDYDSWIRAVFFVGSGFLSITVLSQYVKCKKQFSSIFNIMFVMIILHNIIGWYELVTGDYRFVDMAKFDPYSRMTWNVAERAPVSILGNPNDYATLMVFGVFIAYICLANSKSLLWKLLCAITMVSCSVLCIRSDSRANIIGLIIGISILFYFSFLKKSHIKILLALLILPLIGYAYPTFFESIFSSVSGRLQFNFNAASGSDVTRFNLIKNGFVFLRDTLGFGTGAGNVEYWMETKRVYDVGRIRDMHNWWMEILVGYGVVVFVLYLWVYIKMTMNIYSTAIKANNKFIKTVSLGLLCCMTSFVIASVSSSSNMSGEWLWLFWGVVIAFQGYITTVARGEQIEVVESNYIMEECNRRKSDE